MYSKNYSQPVKQPLKTVFAILSIVFLMNNISIAGNEKNYEWKTVYETGDLIINYKYGECHIPADGLHQEQVFLQFINHTDKEIKVDYDKELWYNNKCITCNSDGLENHHTLILKPGETAEGSCDNHRDKAFNIVSKVIAPGAKSVLTDFKLNDIKVSDVNLTGNEDE